jgi:nicotinamide riboside kinase
LKVLITGPESSGKSYLARHLAWCLDGIFVAEQARAYLNARGGHYTNNDLPLIWEAQRRAEEEAIATGASIIICDTGPEVIQIWSEVKYGSVNATVLDAVYSRQYDLQLLCKPDIPWYPDPLRETPDDNDRRRLYDRYSILLPAAVIIEGTDRVAQAMTSVERHLHAHR